MTLEDIYGRLETSAPSRPAGLHGRWLPLEAAQAIWLEGAEAVLEECLAEVRGQGGIDLALRIRIRALAAPEAGE